MRFLCSILLVLGLSSGADAQHLAAFHDQRDFFHIFDDGRFLQASVQPVEQWTAGFDYLAYVDNRGFLMIYFEGETNEVPVLPSTLHPTRVLLAYSNGGNLFVLDGDRIRAADPWFTEMLATGDSILVYRDRFDRTMVYASGDTSTRMEEFGMNIPPKAAANIVAYTDDFDQLKVWYKPWGYTEVVESSPVRSFDVGDHTVAYVDNTDIFKVWHRGDVYDLQNERPQGFKAGEDLVAWVDRLGRLVAFYDGDVYDLLDYRPQWYEVTENLVYYLDDFGNLRLFTEGEKHILTRYEPAEVRADQDILIWPDLDGYIWGWVNGTKSKLTDEIATSFELSRQAIVYNTNPFVFKVWSRGTNHRFQQ